MMPRLVAVLSGLLCATNALRPQTRHQFLQNLIKGAALATPIAATASTRDYTPADEDMKGLLSGYKSDLTAKEKARDRVHVLFFARARRTRVA